jgi:hypothetical protein
MSENLFSGGVTSYEVKPYKKPKIKIVAYILSFLYLVFVCLPLFIFVYSLITVSFWIMDIHKFYKKTIKYAKTKFKSKPS